MEVQNNEEKIDMEDQAVNQMKKMQNQIEFKNELTISLFYC